MAESFPDRWAFFLLRPRGPSRSAGLLSMLSFYEPTAFDFVQLSKVTSGDPHQNISNPIWRFWHLHFVHVSSHGLIYLPYLILIFFFFCSWRKSVSSLFQKKNGLSVFFHTAPIPLSRRRKLLIFSFQNYKQTNRINPLKKILIFLKID